MSHGSQVSCEPYCKDGHDVDGVLTCTKCGSPLCTDCGTAPVHWWLQGSHYPRSHCRRCHEKGGYRYDFVKEVDVDKLREEFAGDQTMIEAFLERVSP